MKTIVYYDFLRSIVLLNFIMDGGTLFCVRIEAITRVLTEMLEIRSLNFLSIMAGTAPDFPPSLWDMILPQAEITINLLRQSNSTPKVSAYAYLSGPFNYKKMPMAPRGISVQVHEKTYKRGTWVYHTVEGWYLATSPEHYRTHICHIKSTNSERFTDTIHFNHKKITRPTITHADKVMAAISDCTKAIKTWAREMETK